MSAKPVGQRLGLAPFQQVDGRMRVQVNEQRGIPPTPPQSEIINAERYRHWVLLDRGLPQQAEHGIRTDGDTQVGCNARTAFAPGAQSEPDEQFGSLSGAPLRPRQSGIEAFREGAPRTTRRRATEAAYAHHQSNRSSSPGQVLWTTHVPVVDLLTARAACGTDRRRTRAGSVDDDRRPVLAYAAQDESGTRKAGEHRQPLAGRVPCCLRSAATD
jgi:hypothetical protein